MRRIEIAEMFDFAFIAFEFKYGVECGNAFARPCNQSICDMFIACRAMRTFRIWNMQSPDSRNGVFDAM